MFKFSSLGHAMATAAQAIVSDARLLETVMQKAQADAPLVESLTAFISPQASLIERAAFGVLGKVSHAALDAGAAAGAGGLNVQFDAAEIADVRALVQTLLAHPIVQTSGLVPTAVQTVKGT